MDSSSRLPYRRRHVSGPHGESVPVDIMEESGAVFAQAVDELTGEGGGQLQELISVEEGSHGGVQTKMKKAGRPLSPQCLYSLLVSEDVN